MARSDSPPRYKVLGGEDSKGALCFSRGKSALSPFSSTRTSSDVFLICHAASVACEARCRVAGAIEENKDSNSGMLLEPAASKTLNKVEKGIAVRYGGRLVHENVALPPQIKWLEHALVSRKLKNGLEVYS